MSQRYTVRDAERATVRLAHALGLAVVPSSPHMRKSAQEWEVPCAFLDREASPVGYTAQALTLEHAACYGGYRVDMVGPDGTGHQTPLGHDRCGPRDFCDRVTFAIATLRMARGDF